MHPLGTVGLGEARVHWQTLGCPSPWAVAAGPPQVLPVHRSAVAAAAATAAWAKDTLAGLTDSCTTLAVGPSLPHLLRR